jgi:Ca2+-binding EF-hand superfamily protein
MEQPHSEEKIREKFKELDTDGTGKLGIEKMVEFFQAMEIEQYRPSVQKMMGYFYYFNQRLGMSNRTDAVEE